MSLPGRSSGTIERKKKKKRIKRLDMQICLPCIQSKVSGEILTQENGMCWLFLSVKWSHVVCQINIYLITVETRFTLALACDMMTTGLVVAIAATGAILTPETIRTTMSANLTLRTKRRVRRISTRRKKYNSAVVRNRRRYRTFVVTFGWCK